jgi:hypothetical protein
MADEVKEAIRSLEASLNLAKIGIDSDPEVSAEYVLVGLQKFTTRHRAALRRISGRTA